MASEKKARDYDTNDDWEEHMDQLSQEFKEAWDRDQEELKHEVWNCTVGDYLELLIPISPEALWTREPGPEQVPGKQYRVVQLLGRRFLLRPLDGQPNGTLGVFNLEVPDAFRIIDPPPLKPGDPPHPPLEPVKLPRTRRRKTPDADG